MRLVVHDYSGHPFQAQLSRELAKRGHRVSHEHCSSYTTGKGSVERLPADPATFDVRAFTTHGTFARYSPARRVVQELQYGAKLAGALWRRPPDAVVMCNIPLIAHTVAATMASARGIPMVFWQQDVYSDAIGTAARRRLGRTLGGALEDIAVGMERWVARRSSHVVPISDDFLGVLRAWGVPDERITVIPNWAALDEMPTRSKNNAWSRAHGLHDREVVLYSGTLGLKHDPHVLSELAAALRTSRPSARVVVVSEGSGRAWLEEEKRRSGLDNLILLDYQPYELLPEVLASGDILVTVLEPDASRYSVPSKVLNYLCAARPILGVMPADNNAATTIVGSGAGVVVAAGHREAVATEVAQLLADVDRRRLMGDAGRRHAERFFDIARVGDDFERILLRLTNGQTPRRVQPNVEAVVLTDTRSTVEARR